MDSSHAAHLCTDSHASDHTDGTNLPHIKLGWAKWRREFQAHEIIYYLERSDGAVKIGCTSNYPQRREALMGRHGLLQLVAWEPGYYDLEEHRHRQFAHLRIDPIAEWFRVDADLYDHLLMLLAML